MTAGRRVWILAATGLCLLPLAGCRRDSAEERLRRRITGMRDAVRNRKVAVFMAGVDPDFIGPGGMDHGGVRRFLRLQLLRNSQLGVTLGPVAVQLRGAEAEVSFKAMLTGGDGGLLPDAAGGWTVRSGWRDGADGWRVMQAGWDPVF